jgi:hypothetical protein
MADNLVPVAKGVDYSVRWSPALLRAMVSGGYTFAVRYIGTPGRGKNLTLTEIAALRARGVDVVAVFEDREGTALLGYAQGVKDAKRAFADADRLGMPADRPIYFAVDTDTTVARVREYFRGLSAAYPLSRIGVYGGYQIVKGLADEGLVTWLWQTRAWSKFMGRLRWDYRAHLAQFPMTSHDVVLGACDLDWALKADYGQWEAIPTEEGELTTEEKILLTETNELAKRARVSDIARSNDAEAIIAQLRDDPALASKLLANAKKAAEIEKARLGLK